MAAQLRPYRPLLDIGLWLIGAGIALKQAGIGFPPPERVSDSLVWMALAAMSGPAGIAILSARFGGGRDTTSSPPESPAPESPPSSSGESQQEGK